MAETTLAPAAILARITERFPDTTPFPVLDGVACLLVPADRLPAVALFVRDEPDLDFTSLMDLAGLDLAQFPGEKKGEFPSSDLAVTLHLHSLIHRHHLRLRVHLPRANPVVPSVTGLWPVANLFEREVYDLFGVTFTGHPDLRRIMLPEDWEGHPLRKDYAYPTTYGGVALRRDGQKFDGGPYA